MPWGDLCIPPPVYCLVYTRDTLYVFFVGVSAVIVLGRPRMGVVGACFGCWQGKGLEVSSIFGPGLGNGSLAVCSSQCQRALLSEKTRPWVVVLQRSYLYNIYPLHIYLAKSMDSLLGVYTEMLRTGELPPEIWDEWLWRTDPEEPFAPDVLLNRCQLLGFLVCLAKGVDCQGNSSACAVSDAGVDPSQRLTLMEKQVKLMTLRELKDTVENIQIEWPSFLRRLEHNPCAQDNLDAVLLLIDQCVGRFGQLCLSVHTGETLDDLGSVEAVPGLDGGFRITRACIRRTVCTFLVLYRHLHLLSVCETVPACWSDPGITKYHVEASNDEFNLLCMHLSLPVAAKLNYKHDFPGMFNHVSQVVFYHNSEYQRIPRVDLAAFSTASVEHVLPALMQLYPTIGVRYEEDSIDLSGTAEPPQGNGNEWIWMIVAGRVYLVGPTRRVWYSPDVTSLLGVYLAAQAGAQGPGGPGLC